MSDSELSDQESENSESESEESNDEECSNSDESEESNPVPKPIKEIDEFTDIAFHPNLSNLLLASDISGYVKLWVSFTQIKLPLETKYVTAEFLWAPSLGRDRVAPSQSIFCKESVLKGIVFDFLLVKSWLNLLKFCYVIISLGNLQDHKLTKRYNFGLPRRKRIKILNIFTKKFKSNRRCFFGNRKTINPHQKPIREPLNALKYASWYKNLWIDPSFKFKEFFTYLF